MKRFRILIEWAAGPDREGVVPGRERSVRAPLSQEVSARQIVERRSQGRGARPRKVDRQRSAKRSRQMPAMLAEL